MKRLGPSAAALVAVLFSLFAMDVRAQEQDLAVMYEMVPEVSEPAEFEQALAEHARWRRDQGDPWTWDIYQVVTGDNLGTFYARAPQRAWADLDAYDAGFGPRGAEHFNRTVGPHLRDLTSIITRGRPDVSSLPEDPSQMQLFSVIVYRLKPGTMQEFWEVVGRFHEAIVRAEVPVHYGFDSVVAGGSGPEVHLVVMHPDWADFREPEPNVGQALRDAYGEEEAAALGERFSGLVDSVQNMVVRYRPDLSVGR